MSPTTTLDPDLTFTMAEAAGILADTLPAKIQTLLVGPPGIGKTDIVRQATSALGWDLIVSHPAVADPTQFQGLPIPDRGGEQLAVDFVPIGQMPKLLTAQRPTVWFIDDLGQAPLLVQAALMQFCHPDGRELGGHRLSDDVVIVAATNRPTDGAGVRGMLAPLQDRFPLILNVEPTLEAWLDWAYSSQINPYVIAFLQWSETMGRPRLYTQDPDMSQISATCSPRSWKALSSILDHDAIVWNAKNSGKLAALLAASVGKVAGREFAAFLDAADSLPDLAEIIREPNTAPVPHHVDKLYLVVTALAHRAVNHDNGPADLPNMVAYITRLQGDEFKELFRYTVERSGKDDLIKTAEFIRLTAELAHLSI